MNRESLSIMRDQAWSGANEGFNNRFEHAQP